MNIESYKLPVTPSDEPAEIVGKEPLSRSEIIRKLWAYIKVNKRQDKLNRRMINADAKLKPLFKKDKVSIFDLAKIVTKNITPIEP